MRKLTNIQHLGIVIGIASLLLILPQTYALMWNSDSQTKEYNHLLDSTILLNRATTATLSYNRAIKILLNLTNDILLAEYLNREQNKTVTFQEVYLPMLNEAQEFINYGDEDTTLHNEEITQWEQSYSKAINSINYSTKVNMITYFISLIGVFIILIYSCYLIFFIGHKEQNIGKKDKTNKRKK